MNEKKDKLNEALLRCTMHYERISFARNKIKTHFTLNKENYLLLQPEELCSSFNNNYYNQNNNISSSRQQPTTI